MTDIPVTIEMLRDRIQKKRNLIEFTIMEIDEMKRTIIKLGGIE